MTGALTAGVRRTDLRVAAPAIVGGGVLGVCAATASTSMVGALVGLSIGGAALALMLVVTRGRVGDVLFLMVVALISIPLDKYFGARDHVGGWPGLRVSVADAALMALLPVACLGVWLGRVKNVVPRSVYLAYGLLLAQYMVSVLNAPDRTVALFEYAAAVHALVTAAVVGIMFRPALLRPVLALVALQVVVHTTFAILQVVTGRAIGAEWFSGVSIVQEVLTTGAVDVRPSGLFDHPIVYADMLMLAIPLLWAGFYLPGGRLWRVALAVSLLMGLLGLALTLSRGAWIATACASAFLLTLAARQRLLSRRHLARVAWSGLLVAVLVGAPFSGRIYDRLTASNEGNLGVRFELNWIAVSMIEAHPFTGVGLSSFISVMDQYDPTDVMRRFPATVHNIYLLETAETGVVGGVLFVAVFGTILIGGVRRLDHMTDVSRQWVAAALLAGLVGFLISQLADFSHRVEPLRSLLWMNMGLLFALQRDVSFTREPARVHRDDAPVA